MSKTFNLAKFLGKLLESYESIELSAKPKSYFYAIDIEQAFERLKKTDIKHVFPEIKEISDKSIDEIAALLYMPGSSLPKLKIDEVEIARIEVATVLGLVYSLRAEWDDVIRYQLVSEIDDMVFEVPIKESKEPLTLREVIFQFERAEPAVGLSDLVHSLREGESDVLSAKSAFYSGFRQFYEYASAQLEARW